jgi:hypothetical protein
MNSHELARLLLTLPDLPVATHALGRCYFSGSDDRSHGPLKIGLAHHYAGDCLLIGDISRKQINPPNWYVKDMLIGEAPDQWPRY